MHRSFAYLSISMLALLLFSCLTPRSKPTLAQVVGDASSETNAKHTGTVYTEPGDGDCSPNIPVSLEFAARNLKDLCKMLRPYEIARLRGGGSLSGRGHACHLEKVNNAHLGSTLCFWRTTHHIIDEVVQSLNPKEQDPDQLAEWLNAELSEKEIKAFSDQFHEAFTRVYKAKVSSEMDQSIIRLHDKVMKYTEINIGDQEGKLPLVISLHGGGKATSDTNDEQYNNQIDLYRPPHG